MNTRERFIALNLLIELGPSHVRRLLEVCGDIDRLWEAPFERLQQVEGIGPARAQRLIEARRDAASVQRELTVATREGIAVVTPVDAAYPVWLKEIIDPPVVLYVRGALTLSDQVAVAIVGARTASLYGMQTAERFASELALRGITVVSGLARGIDGAAHRGALRAGGRTVAILGSGLCRIYPPEHESLAGDVAKQGALISEYPLTTPPRGINFPRRNRLISGLSLGVVVVEAGSRSGALITADCALEQGREVFAVPGPIQTATSQGTNELLKQGAKFVTSIEDILEELHLACPAVSDRGRGARASARSGEPDRGNCLSTEAAGAAAPAALKGQEAEDATPLSLTQKRILTLLSADQPLDIDAIASQAQLAMPEVGAALLELEIKRAVQQLPGKRFIRLETDHAACH